MTSHCVLVFISEHSLLSTVVINMGGKGKGRKRTASLVSLAASKRTCSQSENNDNTAMHSVDDSSDNESEYRTVINNGDEHPVNCQIRFMAVEQQIKDLKCVISKQSSYIEFMRGRLNFLLSAMGLAEDDIAQGICNSGAGVVGSVDAIAGETSGETSVSAVASLLGSNSDNGTQPGHVTGEPVAEPVAVISSKTYSQAVNRFRTAVVAAVHVEQKDIRRRSRNFVISGLNSIDKISDAVLIQAFLSDNLGLKVTVSGCQRIGSTTGALPRRLLVTLSTVEQAAAVIDAAKRLRFSLSPEIRGKVFINPDLTFAERRAAYELRCRKREFKQRQTVRETTSRVSSLASNHSRDYSVPAPASDAVPAADDTGSGFGLVRQADVHAAVETIMRTPSSAATSTLQLTGPSSGGRSVLSASASSFVPFVSTATDASDGPPPSVDGRLVSGFI